MTTASPVFGTNTAPTVTGLTTLASDSSLVAGWQSGVVDASSIDNLDNQWGFTFTANGTPSAGKQLEIWVGALLDGPSGSNLYPGGLSNAGPGTLTLTAAKKAQLELIRILPSEAVSGQVLRVSGVSIAAVYGGFAPRKYVFWVVHNLGVALSAGALYYDPINVESQ